MNTKFALELRKLTETTKGLKAIYLDDKREAFEAASVRISSLGIECLCTASFQEALRWTEVHRGDLVLILSDMKMPEGTGFDFREKVQKTAPDVPFAILSGHLTTEVAVRGLELKICAFLAKPIQEDDLDVVLGRDVLPRAKSIQEERELRAGFVTETADLVPEAETLLLALEQDPTQVESLNRFFGIVHTLKGASSFFEPKFLHKYTHRYEDILKQLQSQTIPFNEPVAQVLFKGFDRIKELLGEFKSGIYLAHDIEALLSELKIETTAQNPGTVGAVAAGPATPPAGGQTGKKFGEDEIRVAVKLLDEFMQLSGEVTVIRNMLNKCLRSIEKQYSGDRDVAMLGDLLDELHKINGGVQNKITEIRKVPVKAALKTLPRAVRDISKVMGKKISLETEGEDLRVDASLWEVLNNSLLHLVKNSMDHGLEKPEERRAAKKPETGTVFVRCSATSEKVTVVVEDDGRGIPVEMIKKKLLKNGSHTELDIAKMSREQLFAQIFEPGFSTAAVVTDISGRGVGMSMVRDVVSGVGGDIQISSIEGKGTRFTLSLPVPKSVLIANCLFVRCEGVVLGLIQDDIQRAFQFQPENVEQHVRHLQGAQFLILDGDLIPAMKLSEALSMDVREEQGDAVATRNRSFIIVSNEKGGKRLALEVDEILDAEDTVIKGFPAVWNPKTLYRGATYLDDGCLGLIVNTKGLFESQHVTSKPAKDLEKEQPDVRDAESRAAVPEHALLLALPVPGHYAVPLNEIYRIEEIQAHAIQRTGSKEVIPYRGGILEILEPAQKINQGTQFQSDRYVLVVVKRGEGLVGLKVQGVLDMVPVQELKKDLVVPGQVICGHFFYRDSTISMLSVQELIAA